MSLDGIEPYHLFSVRFFWLKMDGLVITIGYLLGSIPFGYLVGKAHGMDIRQHGSGNIGATNVIRVLGKKPGYTVFACDALKGIIAVLLGKYLADHHSLTASAGQTVYHGIDQAIIHTTYFVKLPEAVAAISAAIACIIGHNFPLWLGFKGGKGMATSAGVLIAMMPETAAGCMLVWAAVFFSTRYVSLASIAAAIALPLITMILLLTGFLFGWPYFYFAVAACILAVWRHRSNIVRLMQGTENRFVKKNKEEQPQAQ
jgi:acyl phosphate:glycerol-3-phosphate acyltransferase